MSVSAFFCIFSLVLVLIETGNCWPEGAPFKMCISGFPKHRGNDQQTTPAPFLIRVNQSTYRPSQVLEVTLTSRDGSTFRGFQVGARLASSPSPSSSSLLSSGDGSDVIVGEWIEYDHQTTRLQYWYPEKRGTHNCATHVNNTDKGQIVLLWRAPDRNVGDIVFRSGFVQQFNVFWSSVESPLVRSEIVETPSTPLTPLPSPRSVFFSTGDCGRSKGCFLYPQDCQDENCNFGVTFRYLKDKESVHFEMISRFEGQDEEYFSIGLSTDELMGNDETITCLASHSRSLIQRGYNPEQRNDQHQNVELSQKEVLRSDGLVLCSFLRPVRLSMTVIDENHKDAYRNTTDHQVTFDLAQKHFVMMASGPLFTGSSVIKKHIRAPLVSPRSMDLLGNDVVFGSGIPAYLKAHAILGFFSWFFLSGCAMIVARHSRQVLSRQCSGAACWFQLHRGFVFAALLSTSVLIIVVFASVGEWSQRATNHAILGLTTAGLAVIQGVFGMLRPGLTSNRRPIFNYFHRSLAIVAQILAVATMILGAQIDLLPTDLRYRLTVVIIVSVGVLLCLAIVLEGIRLSTVIQAPQQHQLQPSAAGNVLQLESANKEPSNVAAVEKAKRFLLFLYALSATISLIVFAIYAGLA